VPDPVGHPATGPATAPAVRQPTGGGAATRPAAGQDFSSFLAESLDKVNALQTEAQQGVQRLLTGQTDNTAEVLSAIRKSDIAFSLLLEIRNKLLDAYNELKQMRV
jgi:flagellar hook-basal body complex protein FliE